LGERGSKGEDSMGLITANATPEGTLNYTYDAAGHVASISSGNMNGASMSYTYDDLDRLSTVVDNRLSGNNTTTYSYDNASNVATVTYPNGVQSTFTYDTLNRVTGLSLAELNVLLLDGCRQDRQRRIAGKAMAVGEAMEIERQHLLQVAEEGFELAETSFPTVDGKSCVKVRTNWYSTPVRPGARVRARLLPAYVEIWHERRMVARHERSFGRYEQVLDLEHYLDIFERKPGALAGSRPLQQWRENGHWPETFDRLWRSLEVREGKQAGTRTMIELLQHGSRHGWEKLKHAVQQALDIGCTDAAAVLHLLASGQLRHAPVQHLALSQLERYERPLPVMIDYDLLLNETAEVAR
jgi:YD repeat-containing protein